MGHGAPKRAILDRALASLDRELPLQGEPTIFPLRLRDAIWVATLMPDLTVLASVEPDDARNRCRYVSSHFGIGVTWTSRETTSSGPLGVCAGCRGLVLVALRSVADQAPKRSQMT